MSVVYEICSRFVPGVICQVEDILHSIHASNGLIDAILAVVGTLLHSILVLLHPLQVAQKAFSLDLTEQDEQDEQQDDPRLCMPRFLGLHYP